MIRLTKAYTLSNDTPIETTIDSFYEKKIMHPWLKQHSDYKRDDDDGNFLCENTYFCQIIFVL